MGKGADTTQTSSQGSQTTSYDPWIAKAQQGLAGLAFGQYAGQPYTRAGTNLDQQKAFDLARTGVNQYGYGSPGAVAGAQKYLDGGQMQAARLGGNDYKEFLNPFLDSVGKSTVDTMRREYDNNVAKAGANAANSVAFGGSGAALERAQLGRGFNQDATSTIANLISSGFDRANALASQNVDREQQSRQQNAGNSLQAAGIYGNLYGDDYNRGRSSLADLLGIGTQQQQDTQANLDSRWDMLQKLGAFIPSVYNQTQTSNSTGTQPNQNPSALQSLLGAGLTIGGLPATGGGTLLGNLFG